MCPACTDWTFGTGVDTTPDGSGLVSTLALGMHTNDSQGFLLVLRDHSWQGFGHLMGCQESNSDQPCVRPDPLDELSLWPQSHSVDKGLP